MLIRRAASIDSDDILSWRNDQQSREMFYNSKKVKDGEHKIWFKNALNSKKIELFIGEYKEKKIGICRFDIRPSDNTAEVSINLNPDERGNGFSKKILDGAMIKYLDDKEVDLVARVKIENKASIRLFKSVGFCIESENNEEVVFKYLNGKLRFEKVNEYHSKILYDLLKKREYKISHNNLPSIEEHDKFVRSHPYLHWYLIFCGSAVGTFYIKMDNSIGFNILATRVDWIRQVLRFITTKFQPSQSNPSKVPPYFFINTASDNLDMIRILSDLGHNEIQISHRIR